MATEPIAVVKRTRTTGANALVRAFGDPGTDTSEYGICQRWLAAMREEGTLFDDGWYQPPPGGASVLIGQPRDFGRLDYVSLRDPEVWPRADVGLRDDSLVYAYASPVDRKTGLVGDIGITLYGGPDQSIREHLATCLEISVRTAAIAEAGMELRELFHYSEGLVRTAGLANRATSRTDGGASNIGHTLPWTYGAYEADVERGLQSGDAAAVASCIRRGRVFLNASARLRIEPTMAFTVEPRMASSTLPLSSYHLIVAFSGGERHIYSGFEALFEAFGMDEYLPRAVLDILDCRRQGSE